MQAPWYDRRYATWPFSILFKLHNSVEAFEEHGNKQSLTIGRSNECECL